MNTPATIPAAPLAAAEKKNAIDFLPEDFREPVRFFYGFYSDTLRGTMGLATRFRWWIREDGVTVAEATQAMRSLMSPEKAGAIDTAPRVLALLSAEVDQLVKRRRSLERQQAEKEKAASERANAASPEQVRAALSGVAKDV